MPIAKEARTALFILIVIAVGVNVMFGLAWAWPLWIALAVLAFLSRDLDRKIPAVPLAVVSPVDGRITAVGEARDPYLDRDGLRISIQQNGFGAFVMRSPVEGKVQKRWLRAAGDKPADAALWVETDEGEDIVVSVNLDTWLRHAHFEVQLGERVGHGQRWGLVGFGRPVEIYLPAGTTASVAPHQRVKAGSDTIAKLVRKK